MNEESEQNTFHNRRGSSNIDLTIFNNQLLNTLKNWEISVVSLFQEALILSSNKSFKKRNTTKTVNNKSVPWWTEELTLMNQRLKKKISKNHKQ